MLALLILASCTLLGQDVVLVSVPVYVPFVQALVDDVTVMSVVPQQGNMHVFEPSPEDIQRCSRAVLWFTVGDPFEQRCQQAFPHVVCVDLRDGITPRASSCCADTDPHIWMDPYLMKRQVALMAHILAVQYPSKSQDITMRAEQICSRLNMLARHVDMQLLPLQGKTVIVSHGAFGYLCDRYGIVQKSIETDGKEPSLASCMRILTFAREHKVTLLCAVAPYSRAGIECLSRMLTAQVCELDPYDTSYDAMIEHVVQCFLRAAV